MNGKIRCNKDGTAISPKTRTCPKCGGVSCHIAIHWHEQAYRFYKDANGITFSYMTALDQLAAMNREMRQKSFNADLWQPGAITERKLEHAIERWLSEIKEGVDRNQLSYGTLHAYRSRVYNHILNPEYGLGTWDIREIGAAELKRFSKALPQNLIIRTQREIVHTLRTFFSWAAEEELIPLIPKFPMIRGDNSKEKFALSIEDQAEELQKIPDEHRDVYELETETGIRPGETCALKIKDLNFTAATVKIQRTFTMRRLKEWGDKERHNKSIPLSDRALEIAKKHATGRFPEDWLFTNPRTGAHYTVHRLEIYWKQYTGSPLTHYEATRHSYATQIEEISDMDAAKDLLRQTSIKSTKQYVHRRMEHLRTVQAKRTKVVDLNRAKEQKG